MIHGSCLCGSIRYRAGDPAGPYVYCHCRSCRKASGSAFAANVAVSADSFEILGGDDLLEAYESSPGKRRHFCRRCGSPLYTTVKAHPEVVRIRLGGVDSAFTERPAAHIFVADNPAWHEIADAAPCFSGWPDRATLTIPGSRQREEQ